MICWRSFRPFDVVVVIVVIVIVCWTEMISCSLEKEEEQQQLYMANCRRDLGMSSGMIMDDSLSASSSYDEKSVGPINSRIRQEKNGGAWCPKLPISKEVKEWLQVDLGEIKVISLVETQGRFGNGQGQEYVPNYMLEYQRENISSSTRWIRYRDKKGSQVIRGNSNTYIAELRELRPPVIARRIRFIPWSNHPRMMCMRVELYGCQWTDGVISYSVRQGDKRGPELDFSDFTYDGDTKDGYLSDGLGQLTDWEEGSTNFRLDQTGQGRKGFEWIGWKNDTNTSSPLDIVFHFDQLRNFSSVKLHANNLFTKDVSVFRKVLVYFSLDGESYGEGSAAPHPPLVYEYMKDTLIEAARHIVIPIPHRIGCALKLVFFFELRWLMISEARFESEVVKGNILDYIDLNYTSVVVPRSSPLYFSMTTLNSPAVIGDNDSQSDSVRYTILPAQLESTKTAVLAIRKTDNNDDDDRAGSPNHLVDSDELHHPPNPNNNNNNNNNNLFDDDAYIGMIVGVITAFILSITTIAAILLFRHRRNKYSRAVLKSDLSANRLNFKLPMNSTASNGKLSRGNVYKSIATNELLDTMCEKDVVNGGGNLKMSTFCMSDEYSCTQVAVAGAERIPVYELPHISSGKSFCSELSRRNCTPSENERYSILFDNVGGGQGHGKNSHHSFSSVFLPFPRKLDDPLTLIPPLPPRRLAFLKQQGSSLGNVHGSFLACRDDSSILEISQDALRFIEKLGEGCYIEVYLCEATLSVDESADVMSGDSCSSGRSEVMMTCQSPSAADTKDRPVVVKMLKPHATDQNRLDFQTEMSNCLRLKDPNVVGILGVCFDDPWLPSYVLEYPIHGDLHQFLLSRLPENNNVSGFKHQQCLSYGCLIYMATQLASGMKYLETLNIVHRDLAARNCLVGRNHVVKIVDFGVNRFAYSADYYRVPATGFVVPLRWTAWEGIVLNKFTCKSDVWSFGVTLWEILTMARSRPFETLSDEQVVDVCEQFRLSDGVEEYLDQPTNCPKEIYDLMLECWNRSELHRPTFREIHMFLQQKNAGFDPKEH